MPAQLPKRSRTGLILKSNIFKRGFAALIATQFFGAANDNILKGVLIFMLANGLWQGALGAGGQGDMPRTGLGLCMGQDGDPPPGVRAKQAGKATAVSLGQAIEVHGPELVHNDEHHQRTGLGGRLSRGRCGGRR